MADPAMLQKLRVQGAKLNVVQDEEFVPDDLSIFLHATPREGMAIRVGRNRADSTDELEISEENEVVELALEDDLLLYTSVKRLKEDIIPAAERGEKGDEIILPPQIVFHNQRSRGDEGLVVKTIKVLDLKGKLIDAAGGKAGALAARKIADTLEDHLVQPDILYRLVTNDSKGAEKVALESAQQSEVDSGKPVLLFIHGTASNTTGSFSNLWTKDATREDSIWQKLLQEYGDNIFALEHRTLTRSPIDNVIDLMKKLPEGCRLHLVSHSRGGLVGELLCRAQFNSTRDPFTEEDYELFMPDLKGLAKLPVETKKDYLNHIEQLKILNTLLLDKRPKVERFIRVACPARGTTLASGKLDVYLSGILNVIGLIPALKSSTIYSFLKAFTLAVARERTRPEQLPGLEAQMPGSPFIAMLNSTRDSVNAHLAVIKGDIEPTGILKKISIFFLDQFYESDHDLVVNTPSMDGGARRDKQIPVLFDSGSDTNHFRYFENNRTRDGLLSGLTGDAYSPKGFELEQQRPVHIARTGPVDRDPDTVPAVFVLPGIIGSHLDVDDNRIWLSPFEIVRGGFEELKMGTEGDVEAKEPIALAYKELIAFLAQSHTVIPFPYDWRLSVFASGERLAAAIEKQLGKNDRPLRIVAHSMGGLVVRAMMANNQEIWERFCQRAGSRVLMLGTPNLGSHAATRILTAQEKLVKLIAFTDLYHNENDLLEIFRKFPGLLELLPVDDEGKCIIEDTLWDEFADVLGGSRRRPNKSALGAAQKSWDKLTKMELDPERVFYVAGYAKETPSSVRVEESRTGGKSIQFYSTPCGDGRVPWETGIPKKIRHWYVGVKHGDIPNHKHSHHGYLEILEKGGTTLLASQPPVSREMVREKLMRPDVVDTFPSDRQLLAAGLGLEEDTRKTETFAKPLVQVSVVHGNLHFSKSPLAVGHYTGDTIVSAEAVLDRLLEGRLTKRQMSGVYPGVLHSNDVLFNHTGKGFPGVLIVGLGEVGELSPGTLISTFRDAVIRYVLIGRESGFFHGEPISLSTLLIGTGAGELSVKDSVSSLITGVLQANNTLQAQGIGADYFVSQMEFIELFEDVAIEAQYALGRFARLGENRRQINAQKRLDVREGGRTRASFTEDDDWWQRLRIELTREGGLKFTAFGGRARADIRELPVQRPAVEPFLRRLTTQTAISRKAGRVLFEMLVPADFKTHAGENQRLMLVLDKGAACYPWELLEFGGRTGDEALAIKAGMVRQLATGISQSANVCTEMTALVVGDPDTGARSNFCPLPGARDEAKQVTKILTNNGITVKESLIRAEGDAVLTALMTESYGMLHLAGHGVVEYEREIESYGELCSTDKEPYRQKVTGMVIGEDIFLTPSDIKQLPFTPAFVFINCCHLGKVEGEEGSHFRRRYHLAANLATQLIEQGVKAVIAAGWAVDDNAAQTFAQCFYESFINGMSFGDAVRAARVKTYTFHPYVNTWGAYQCYGDPGYTLCKSTAEGSGENYEKFVSLSEYVVAIKNIAEDARTATSGQVEILRERLGKMLETLPEEYRREAKLLANAGEAWGELDRFGKAIEVYEQALQTEHCDASIRAAEQMANLMSRNALVVAGKGAMADARTINRKAIGHIKELIAKYGETVERYCLLAGAHKRNALLWLGNTSRFEQGLVDMREFYMFAYRKAITAAGDVYAYPLINFLTAEWLLQQSGKGSMAASEFETFLERAREAKMVKKINRETFRDAITVNDCEVLSALRDSRMTDDKVDEFLNSYQDIVRVMSSPRQLRSVVETMDFLYQVLRALDIGQAVQVGMLCDHLKSMSR